MTQGDRARAALPGERRSVENPGHRIGWVRSSDPLLGAAARSGLRRGAYNDRLRRLPAWRTAISANA
jgi:hypothetical protein